MAHTSASLDALRQEIRDAKHAKRPPRSANPMDAWIRRHHDRICDYLAQHLRGYAELSCWDIAYTALHEMLCAVYLQPREHGDDDEARIWATFDPAYFVLVHYPAIRPFSLLPIDFSPRGFQPHYAGFFRFMASLGTLSETHAEWMQAELHHALWGEALGVA